MTDKWLIQRKVGRGSQELRTARNREENGCMSTVAWNLNAGDLQTVYFPVRPGGQPVRQI
jgi:hypothetical protein